jgi:hypothetical protein
LFDKYIHDFHKNMKWNRYAYMKILKLQSILNFEKTRII